MVDVGAAGPVQQAVDDLTQPGIAEPAGAVGQQQDGEHLFDDAALVAEAVGVERHPGAEQAAAIAELQDQIDVAGNGVDHLDPAVTAEQAGQDGRKRGDEGRLVELGRA